MNNYDDLLRDKENTDSFDDSAMEQHWAALEHKIDSHTQRSQKKYRKLFRNILLITAVSLVAFLGYKFFIAHQQSPENSSAANHAKSAISPALPGTDVPYESFSYNAATGDTLFTQNGSIIIFPKHAVLNSQGETVTGSVEIRIREFNDAFDYSIAGIPMDYDSAGTQYKFISSAMIDISAYQNGMPLLVNPLAKPRLNLVSTNKERETNLYKLDTVNGKWINKGKDEVNLVGLNNTDTINNLISTENIYNSVPDSISAPETLPAAPQKASDLNPVISVIIDPASFKELLVYNGLKFEVIDAKAGTVGEDSKIAWDNIELKRGESSGTYKVIFSAKNRKAIYNVKPVLEGKEFQAAEKLYQEKLKAYTRIQTERKNSDKKLENDNKRVQEDNKRMEELNKLVTLRNKFIEAENIKIDALNKAYKRRTDSLKKANSEQQAYWEQTNRMASLEENLIRSFEIDGFGYWNCDQPTLPQIQQYASSFKTLNNEVVNYNTLCIATAGINRIQNYYATKSIGLITNSSYFGWAFNATQIYYFTREDFNKALITKNPNTISISMTLYKGDVKNYNELKGYIFNVNNSANFSK